MRELLGLQAPAKVNLFLHVVGRRDDGYHLLQSAFALIDWFDTLHLEWRAGGAVSREDIADADADGTPLARDASTALPEQDLTVRAARALQQATGCTQGVHIRLHKTIPSEAGMGGGSSDAATCLLALNHLWGLGLDAAALSRIGLTLGADVPFFIGAHHAWVEGIGERLTPIALPDTPLLVIKPPVGLPTAAIFRSEALHRDTAPVSLQSFLDSWRSRSAFGRNDLQPVAESLCPAITEGIDWLAQQGLAGRMTGSGSAMFAIGGGRADLSSLPARWLARHCRILSQHPLSGWAASLG